jgi:tetratricopeptide (TPR) repeat protein
MKKTMLLLAIAPVIFLSACMGGYNVDKNLSAEKEQEYMEVIETATNGLEEEGLTEGEKVDLMENIAVSYDRLGDYDMAIEQFNLILEKDPSNFLSLNNLQSMYEEVGELDLASQYVIQLYDYYPNDSGILSDVIRVFTKKGEFDFAKRVLEDFAKDNNEGNLELISQEYEYIQRMQVAAESK